MRKFISIVKEEISEFLSEFFCLHEFVSRDVPYGYTTEDGTKYECKENRCIKCGKSEFVVFIPPIDKQN